MAKKKIASKEGSIELNHFEQKLKITRDFKLTTKQQKLLKILLNDDIKLVFITGPAGTSKTYIALYAALQKLNVCYDMDMLYLRSAIENCIRTLGHLPGTITEKCDPYTTPMYDKLFELITPYEIKELQKDGRIDSAPINYLRGANWINKYVIVDEAQNMTYNELVTVITRAGEKTKLVLCGDLMQSDIKDSGYERICDVFSDKESQKMGIERFDFDEKDIVRSKLVQFIVTKLKKV